MVVWVWKRPSEWIEAEGEALLATLVYFEDSKVPNKVLNVGSLIRPGVVIGILASDPYLVGGALRILSDDQRVYTVFHRLVGIKGKHIPSVRLQVRRRTLAYEWARGVRQQ